ncbi:GNAT family N-acetyltransferase [Dysgonomonas sp. ZJ709]|uniref:GNAT family N-acetyltransferase n=1 Tax=Dysgonomonas sp. ZJ709 TaxID=2709797 RepID=UPI0013ED01C4|nr:GNAT family N-acetyltransferase [Dysgonomonas sp. ZJ709]
MIQFANKEITPLVRQMWKICFDDTDQFMDLYFSNKYREGNTLVYFEENRPVASLQMLPYTITFYGENIPFYYLAGLCTLPEYRKKGYMAQLIYKSHQLILDRGVALSILIPAEDWLYGFYEKYGYEQVFEKGEELLPSLKDIINTTSGIEDAYQLFSSLYGTKDFCVQKSFADFKTIIEDSKEDDYPAKTNLSAMACIIDPKKLLSIYARKNTDKTFSIKVDEYIFRVENGRCSEIAVTESADFNVDIRLLCRLLFGYKTGELDEKYKTYFPLHHPVINLMLE